MSTKGATMLAKTRSEDVIKNHEKSQKTLLSFEAERILKVLENCINQVEIVATLPAVLRLNSVMDKQLSKALQEHQILDEKLETVEHLKWESGDLEQEGVVRKARTQVEKDIKNSARDLLRIVRAKPEAMCGLRAELVKELGDGDNEHMLEVGDSERMLIRGLKTFHIDVGQKLMTSLDEEVQQLLQEQEFLSTASDLERMISQEDDKKTIIKGIDENISKKNDKIKYLQSFLQGRSRQNVDMSLLVDSQRQSLLKTSEVKHTSMQQQIDQLNTQLSSLALENRQAERVIQEKNENVEAEIEYLLQMFDAEIGEIQANLELNETDYDKEEEEQKKLEKPFSVLEVECNQILEKRRLAEEKRKEEIKELELKTKAAIFAQAWWRGYSTRKALKNKSKSKKVKKGKGKKTK
ncbi:dynein regulatory complex protein 10 [Centropristis striata]|uniref:dynein regulatory complex protein 10 n=1 Tax=Centropristis striata TaxID=184440 RepID=UPI0027DFA3C7|nr:dynein regulatory complex protein 10 [Centropristis striata]